MKAECNIDFFAALLKKNIATRDIFYFVQKQAHLRKVHRDLDKPLTRAAVRSKLNDACSFAFRQKRVVSRLKQEVLLATGNKRYTQKKILKQVRTLIREEKLLQSQNDAKKLSRYEKLQSQMMSESSSSDSFVIPASIDQFKSLKVFGPQQEFDFVPEPPMIYDESISLSENERLILSKGPKFAVRQQLMAETFKVEVEKMICKQKFNEPQDCQLEPSVASQSSVSAQ